MRRKFHTLDVFTNEPLAGNPLAVVLDSDGLDTARMQAVAREFNLSETVFVFEPRDPVNTARIRIFTPGREVPFAGHPTVGTAVLLAELRAPEMLVREDVGVVLEEAVGPVSCTVRHIKGEAPRASFVLPRLPEFVERLGSAAAISAALGLAPEDIGFGAHEPARWSAGVPFGYVPLASRAALGKINLNMEAWPAAFGGARVPIFAYCDDPQGKGHAYRARMFAPDMGIAEDPATGAAAAGFSGVVMSCDKPADGDHTLIIEQGFEMGRPSLITLGLDVSGGKLTAASIGGHAVMVAQGVIDV
jgi:trans-2,3-dihydro-3-hydroxyanthranilate isomerase